MKRVWILMVVVGLTLLGCGRGPDKKRTNNDTANSSSNDAMNAGSNNAANAGSNNATTGACGNGVLEADEACDPAIESGDGACPNTCQTPPGTCGEFALVGSASDCTGRCELEPAACADGDDCCPIGCDAATDGDCSNTCGNGVVEEPEVCDGDCPQSCDDGDACTVDTMRGSVDACSATCAHDIVSACTDGDGCCPAGCTPDTDDDCSDQCGNGTIDAGETCDGDCPQSCDDQNECTRDSLSGSADNCSASCVFSQITNCTGGDGCCPAGCTSQTDSDCMCTPTTSCSAMNYDCGTIFNGCEDVSCGTCGGSEACVNNRCEDTFGIGEACTGGGSCSDCITEFDAGWDGGYCSRGCASSLDCGALAHCGLIDPDTGNGACLLDCSSNSDCTRAGYECFDADQDGTNECAPTGSGFGAVGDACTKFGDCAGGQGASCLRDPTFIYQGYCIDRCTSNADCASGSHCAVGWGTCLDSCGSNSDCRGTGYACYDADEDGTNECWHAATGPGGVGDPCATLWDCSGGQYGFCATEEANGFPGGYCLVTCGPNRGTCPAGSECILPSGGADEVCLDLCDSSTDCRGSYTCTSAGTPSDTVCWL